MNISKFVATLFWSVVLLAIGLAISWVSGLISMHEEAHVAGHAPVLAVIGSAFLHVGAGVVFFVILDSIFLRFLDIRAAFYGRGHFERMPPAVRAEFVRGWFIVFAAVIVAFAWAGV